jgi:hypothetical protein
MAEMKRVAKKFCFKADLSVTGTLVLVQKAYGIEAMNRSNVFSWYYLFQDGRGLVEDEERGGGPKSTRTKVNTAVVADFIQKNLPSNRIKNVSRIFEHPRVCSSSDSKRGFGKEKVV